VATGTIMNNSNNLMAMAQTSKSISNTSSFHAKGLIGTLVSHLLTSDITNSLGIVNSTNLLRSTYLHGLAKSGSETNTSSSSTPPMLTIGNSTNLTVSKSLYERSLTNPNILLPKIYISDGDWKLDVINGKVQNFIANFTEVLTTGNNPHIHTITNFRAGNNSSYLYLSSENSISFSGTADIFRNGKLIWPGVPVKVFIAKGYVIGISVDPTKSDNHFRGIPIFGTVTSLTGKDGKELRTSILATSGNSTSAS